MASVYYFGCKKYFTGEDSEATLTDENERVDDESRYTMPIFVCGSDRSAALSKLDLP